MPSKYVVELTDIAETVYNRLADEAEECMTRGDVTNERVTQFKMVEKLLDKIILHDPLNRGRSLSVPLSNIFRVKTARIRICYIVSSKLNRITVLYISDTPRKEGDTRDPYAVLTKLVLSGRFDAVFDLLGVKRPNRRLRISAPRTQ